jgi:hypothetical protein
MFTFAFLQGLWSLLKAPTFHDNLEAYITAGQPQTPDDVDRLEREFWEQKRRQSMFFFHE